jgi:hypothetical protein
MPGIPFRLALCVLACAVGLLAVASVAPAAKPRPAGKRAHLILRRRAHRLQLLRAERRRNRIVVLAWRAVGVPYRWGGNSPRGGFDCSGLTQWVYRHVGIALPHYSAAQFRYGRRVPRRALRPGDLLFFSGLGHVGIYLGHGALIHAPHPGARVQFTHLSGWLASSFYAARRLA